MSARLMGWLAAVLAMLVTLALIAGEITNAGQRHWWGSHSLTTDTVSGLMVPLMDRTRNATKRTHRTLTRGRW